MGHVQLGAIVGIIARLPPFSYNVFYVGNAIRRQARPEVLVAERVIQCFMCGLWIPNAYGLLMKLRFPLFLEIGLKALFIHMKRLAIPGIRMKILLVSRLANAKKRVSTVIATITADDNHGCIVP